MLRGTLYVSDYVYVTSFCSANQDYTAWIKTDVSIIII